MKFPMVRRAFRRVSATSCTGALPPVRLHTLHGSVTLTPPDPPDSPELHALRDPAPQRRLRRRIMSYLLLVAAVGYPFLTAGRDGLPARNLASRPAETMPSRSWSTCVAVDRTMTTPPVQAVTAADLGRAAREFRLSLTTELRRHQPARAQEQQREVLVVYLRRTAELVEEVAGHLADQSDFRASCYNLSAHGANLGRASAGMLDGVSMTGLAEVLEESYQLELDNQPVALDEEPHQRWFGRIDTIACLRQAAADVRVAADIVRMGL